MIYDLLLLDDELDMLECRLTELGDIVDRFVIAESVMVLADGRTKPLNYAENQHRFAPWSAKITYIPVVSLPPGDPFARERFQRDALTAGLTEAGHGDLVMLSDIDEIPSVPAVLAAQAANTPLLFEQTACYFAVDWVAPVPWLGTCSWPAHLRLSPGQVRYDRGAWPHLPNAGWHLSWLGGPEAITAKIANRCYTDERAKITAYNEQGLLYEQGWLWWMPDGSGPGYLKGVDITDDRPAWVLQGACPQIWFRPGRPEVSGRMGP